MTRILIADDQPMIRTALSQLISRAGEDWELCGAADNGRAAVEQATELKPDLVVLDMQMPQMDGISAGRAIRASFSEMPILIYTMFDAAALEPAARQAGLQGVVQKSKGAEILHAIRDVLSGKIVFSGAATAEEVPQRPASDPASTQADATSYVRPRSSLSCSITR